MLDNLTPPPHEEKIKLFSAVRIWHTQAVYSLCKSACMCSHTRVQSKGLNPVFIHKRVTASAQWSCTNVQCSYTSIAPGAHTQAGVYNSVTAGHAQLIHISVTHGVHTQALHLVLTNKRCTQSSVTVDHEQAGVSVHFITIDVLCYQ